jgi:hypothetical protein
MSKGFGHVERAILETLQTEPYCLDTFQLAAAVFKRAPNGDGICIVTKAEIVSVHRAAHKLIGKTGVRSFGRENRRSLWGWWDEPKPRWQPVVIQGSKTTEPR